MRVTHESPEQELRDLAASWLSERKSPAFGEGDTFDEVLRLLIDEPELLWRVVLLMIEMSDEGDLGAVAAGPLEDLLRDHARQFVDRVEQQASESVRFRRCLGKVAGGWSGIPIDLCPRLHAAGLWPRLDAAGLWLNAK
jgi:hypothetical protein